jgi:putative sigma-54 modulation protein
MKIVITARHFEASDDLKAHIEGHLDDVERFLDRVNEATVILAVEKYRHRAEIIVTSPIKQFVSAAVTDDMYKSVDECIDKLKAQFKRSKEKLKSHKAGKTATADNDTTTESA